MWGGSICSILVMWTPFVADAFLPSIGYSFKDYNRDFDRGYEPGTAEYVRRKAIFDEKLEVILMHNADPKNTWKRGVNEYTDKTDAEFKLSRSMGYNRPLARHFAAQDRAHMVTTTSASMKKTLKPQPLPDSWDWREKGVISNVKNQGHCGSCWAFAATANIESHAAIASGTLESLSPQQLVSCAPNPMECGGFGGCKGSIPEVAYHYVQLYGMTTESMIPYSGEDMPCSLNMTSQPIVVEISGYQTLPPNDYTAVMEALVHIGPLAVNVQASWRDYHSGVFDGCKDLSRVTIDHVVQLVGYGIDPDGGNYWLVRNSWDTYWGESGYIRLKRSASPECGEDLQPQAGTGCSGGPPTQHVCGQCGILFDASYPLGARVIKQGLHEVVV